MRQTTQSSSVVISELLLLISYNKTLAHFIVNIGDMISEIKLIEHRHSIHNPVIIALFSLLDYISISQFFFFSSHQGFPFSSSLELTILSSCLIENDGFFLNRLIASWCPCAAASRK